MKICSKCGREKALDAFYNKQKAKDGKCSQCKSCQGEQQRAWIKQNHKRVYDMNYKTTYDRRLKGQELIK